MTAAETIQKALGANYVAAARSEEAAWDSLRRHRDALVTELKAHGIVEPTARKMIAAVEGKRRIDPQDPDTAAQLARIGQASRPDLAGAWLQAAREWSDASDRSFRASSELADFGGPELRQRYEALTEMGELKRELLSTATRINPTLDVRFVRELYGEGPALMASGASSTDRMPVAGMFEPLYNMATVSLDRRFDRKDTTYHEGFHSIEGVLTKAEREALRRAFPPQGAMTSQERTAIAFADWAQRRERLEDMGLGDELKGVRRAFRKMGVFSGRARQSLLGRGFEKAEDIFERVYGGEMGTRAIEAARNGRARPQGKAAAAVAPTQQGPDSYSLSAHAAQPAIGAEPRYGVIGGSAAGAAPRFERIGGSAAGVDRKPSALGPILVGAVLGNADRLWEAGREPLMALLADMGIHVARAGAATQGIALKVGDNMEQAVSEPSIWAGLKQAADENMGAVIEGGAAGLVAVEALKHADGIVLALGQYGDQALQALRASGLVNYAVGEARLPVAEAERQMATFTGIVETQPQVGGVRWYAGVDGHVYGDGREDMVYSLRINDATADPSYAFTAYRADDARAFLADRGHPAYSPAEIGSGNDLAEMVEFVDRKDREAPTPQFSLGRSAGVLASIAAHAAELAAAQGRTPDEFERVLLARVQPNGAMAQATRAAADAWREGPRYSVGDVRPAFDRLREGFPPAVQDQLARMPVEIGDLAAASWHAVSSHAQALAAADGSSASAKLPGPSAEARRMLDLALGRAGAISFDSGGFAAGRAGAQSMESGGTAAGRVDAQEQPIVQAARAYVAALDAGDPGGRGWALVELAAATRNVTPQAEYSLGRRVEPHFEDIGGARMGVSSGAEPRIGQVGGSAAGGPFSANLDERKAGELRAEAGTDRIGLRPVEPTQGGLGPLAKGALFVGTAAAAGVAAAELIKDLPAPSIPGLWKTAEAFRADPADRETARRELQGLSDQELLARHTVTRDAVDQARNPVDRVSLRTGLQVIEGEMRGRGLEAPGREVRPAKGRGKGMEM